MVRPVIVPTLSPLHAAVWVEPGYKACSPEAPLNQILRCRLIMDPSCHSAKWTDLSCELISQNRDEAIAMSALSAISSKSHPPAGEVVAVRSYVRTGR